ncbi:C1 family peptidase [Fibrella sp. HMF5335]|uniref:C1 family peptidase n=1 Tax=Fibrella rubiginis TaxID=2817060 RepID=A0A939GCI9_9BACT|nr:C1 family peptidase [Fibrella rubiginis]MBO0935278.1 C1 family peptidase [Fibrella rubiginis]
MKTAWLTGYLLLLLTLPAAAQTDSIPGLLLDDAGYAQVPYQAILIKTPLPDRVSFEALCPPVREQGAYGTCVGFACGYYLRTILEAKARKKTTKAAISRLAFSPSYLYEKAKATNDYACVEGVYLTKVFAVLRDVGSVPFSRFPYPACGQQTSAVDQLAARYRIRDYERLFNVQDSDQKKIDQLKKALANGSPVVVGMVIPPSFYTAANVWTPAPTDNPQNKHLRGHALCLVGYDDNRFGGAFRVVNSFGKRWADAGFCWIRYQDMARFTRYGFVVN